MKPIHALAVFVIGAIFGIASFAGFIALAQQTQVSQLVVTVRFDTTNCEFRAHPVTVEGPEGQGLPVAISTTGSPYAFNCE